MQGATSLTTGCRQNFAGPNNIAYGMIDFLTHAPYEDYRKALADDPLHQHNADELTRSSAVINMERSIIELQRREGTVRMSIRCDRLPWPLLGFESASGFRARRWCGC